MQLTTIKTYVQSQTTLEGRINAIEILIDEMLLNTIDTIEDSGTMAYTVDDGQMKLSTQFRSSKDIAEGIRSLEKLKQVYVNRLNGNLTVLRGRLNH